MTVLVSDSFNRANGALGSTDSYNGGTSIPWQSNTANFVISNNKGSVNALDGNQYTYVDVGQSDVTITADLSQTSTLSDCPKLIFRANDYTNFYIIHWTSSWKLEKYVNNTGTTLSTTSSVGGPTSTNVVTTKVVCSGSSISWYLNGALIGTVTDSTFTGTKHGWGTQRVQGLVDNFQIEGADTGGTGTDATITSVIANTTASALAPTLSTSSSASVTVSSVIANASASSLPPVITVQKQVSVSSVIASAMASGLAPQVGSFTNAAVNSVVANASASSLNPSISTIRNISVISPISSAIASALIPSVVVPMSTRITAIMASVLADGLAPMIYLNQSIWKSGNKPSTAWLLPTDNKLTFAQLKNRKFNNYKATFGGKRVTIWT